LAKLALGRSAGAGQSGAFHSQGLNDLSQRPLCHSCNKMAFCGQASVLSMAKVGSLLEEQESTSCLIRTKAYRPKLRFHCACFGRGHPRGFFFSTLRTLELMSGSIIIYVSILVPNIVKFFSLESSQFVQLITPLDKQNFTPFVSIQQSS
jgi:hypothetical protein